MRRIAEVPDAEDLAVLVDDADDVGEIKLLSKAPNPYGTGDPIKTVDWYVSKNFGSFTGIPEAINDLSYTPP